MILLNNISLIPQITYFIFFKSVTFILIFYLIIICPLSFSFNYNISLFIYIFIHSAFIIDFFINFCIGFFKEEEKLIKNLKL